MTAQRGRRMRLQFQNRYFNKIGRTASHLYIRPHPLLEPYVAHYTITMAGGEVRTDTLALVPDASGCLIFGPTINGLEGTVYGATTRTVVVRGSASVLDQIDASQLRIVADLSDVAGTGIRSVPAQVYLDASDEVGVIGTYTISVNITQ